MKQRITNRLFAGVLILSMTLAGSLKMPKEAKAETKQIVQYQKVAESTFKEKIGKEAPECTLDITGNTGYLFAGWFKSANNNEPITSADGISGDVYAKFVPSYLAGIACQADTNENADKRDMRVVSLVDSKNYQAVGFNIYGRYNADGSTDGSNETEWLMYQYKSDGTNKAQSTKVFSGLRVYTSETDYTVKAPKDVFGAEAEGFYFTTVSIAGLGKGTNSNNVAFDLCDATMVVKPYWITLDGTYVEGMGEFNRVNDYKNKIVNISVNLKNAKAIAAGMLEIVVPETFQSCVTDSKVQVESGSVFEEMESAVVKNTIRCVGNVKELNNSQKANEVYVNLRISVNDYDAFTKGSSEFTVIVPENGFCDIDETFDKNVTAWNVRY